MPASGSALRIGLFSVGLEAYWSQFDGLRERLTAYNRRVAELLDQQGASVVNLGLIDAPEKAFAAGHRFRQEDVDVLFLHVATYALSATVLPVLRRAKTPVIVLNLAPGPAIDYAAFNQLRDRRKMTGEWLAWCQACPVPEIASVLRRCRIPFFQVTGMLENDAAAETEIAEWVAAARVAQVMEHNRLGLMGHPYAGMLDVYPDLIRHAAAFGGHAELIEAEELAALRRDISEAAAGERCRVFEQEFEIEAGCEPDDLKNAARTSLALDRMAEKHALGSFAYFYQGSGNPEHEALIASMILGSSLLTARGIPVAGEYEVKNAQAMKIMDAFGAGGSFSEPYALDFNEDMVLMGHDGPGHIAIAAGKTKVRPLAAYHGKVARGLSVEMSVKPGPVTLLSVVETEAGSIRLLTAEAEAVTGPILEIGNTNSRYRFACGARKFIETWSSEAPAHHCAIGVGHIAGKIAKLGALLGLEVKQVC